MLVLKQSELLLNLHPEVLMRDTVNVPPALKIRNDMRNLIEVVKIFDVEPFEAGEGDLFRFRVEITRDFNGGLLRGIVYRLETYRLQPTYPLLDGQPCEWSSDALLHVIDDNYDADSLSGHSVDEVLEKFQAALAARFG
ncbi:hypothetical protein [Acidovorax sp. ACV01]|uniref:hypothetical protein n=1 Tax=Acidovorax sp. ACV01 TaxID=2769311 RepID=UPI001CE177B0|nr:hypothetical protein [Acidovorax sp. ACV01]